jgi:hypothetical protein
MADQLISPRNGQVLALSDQGREPFAMPWHLSGTTLRKSIGLGKELAERRLIRAYLALYLAPAGEDGARTVSLARFGAFEVRLVEVTQALSAEIPPLWLELYAHGIRSSLDSCGCDEFEEAVLAADAFVAQAKELHQRPGSA